MYSATFALTAILGIALTNLFLGFAFALLIGRRPKSLSDFEDAITIRYFSPQLLFPFSRRTARRSPVHPVATPVAVPSPIAASPPVATFPPLAASSACSDPAPSVSPSSVGVAAPAPTLQSIAIAGTTPRLVLPPKPVARPAEDEAPDVVLGRQLEAWQASDPREETPCLSGFAVTLHNGAVDDHVREALINAVHGKITSQLRKDRRVLRTAENHFLWFSADVHPDDGLLPVGRDTPDDRQDTVRARGHTAGRRSTCRGGGREAARDRSRSDSTCAGHAQIRSGQRWPIDVRRCRRRTRVRGACPIGH